MFPNGLPTDRVCLGCLHTQPQGCLLLCHEVLQGYCRMRFHCHCMSICLPNSVCTVALSSSLKDTHQRELHFTAVQSLLTQHGQALVNGVSACVLVFCVCVCMCVCVCVCVCVGLVSGFVLLPTYMLMESSEVLWELLVCAREVSLY